MLNQQLCEGLATALPSEELDKGSTQKFIYIMFLKIRDFTLLEGLFPSFQ